LVEFKPEDVEILRTVPPHMKKKVRDGIWSVLLSDVVDPEYAEFIRDWIFLKLPEAVASLNNLDIMQVLEYFARNDKSFLRAGEKITRDFSRYQNRS
jgi:hypothetical protein